MAHLDEPRVDHVLDLLQQLEQAQQVTDRGARAANGVGRLLVGHLEIIDQAAQGGGLLQRVEVLALDVLDQGHRDGNFVRDVADHRGDALDSGHLRRPPAALAGDQLEFPALGQRPDDNGLDHALGADRVRQLGEFLRIEH